MARRVICGPNEVEGAVVVKIHLPPRSDPPPDITPFRLEGITLIGQPPRLVIVQNPLPRCAEQGAPVKAPLHLDPMIMDQPRDSPCPLQHIHVWQWRDLVQFDIPHGRRRTKSGFPFCDI